MKICLAHNLYGKFSRGGAETAVGLMAADLKKSGHEVFLITTKPKEASATNNKDSDNDKDDRAEPGNSDLKIYYLNSRFYNLASLNIIARFFWQLGNLASFKKYRALKKIFKKEKPELVITHNLMGLGFLMPKAIRKLKIRHEHFLHDLQLLNPSGLMIYGHENILDSFPARIYQSLTRVLFSSPAKIISPSKWLLDTHIDRGFFKESAVEVRPFEWAVSDANGALKKDFNKFLFVGQIEEQKGVFLLINAFKKIAGAELSLTIVSRNSGGKIKEAIEAAKSDGRIKIISPLSFEEAKKLMEISGFLVVPSLCYENSPTVIYGAHAAQMRVIAADLGGIPEICGANDLLFEPGNEHDLIEKINRISENKQN